MSGGFGSFGNSILKNNKRKKVDKLSRLSSQTGAKFSKKEFEKRSSPHQLKEIREKLQRENKIAARKKILILIIIMVIFIYLIGFVSL